MKTALNQTTDHQLRTTDHGPTTGHSAFSLRGFTMIEIAISLAIIGFALVAILGILPIGMGMQKQNRQETIINQDASVFLDAIRNGAQGLDDLTNYVFAITNFVGQYAANGKWVSSATYGYRSGSSSSYPLNSGYRIVGLLSTPKFVPYGDSGGRGGSSSGYYSNHVVAYVHSLSGPASEKFPQNNGDLQDLGFSYRLMPEVITYGTYHDPSFGNPQPLNVQSNLHELRLTFRWPLVDPKGKAGPMQQSFRSIVGGSLQATNEFGYPNKEYTLYFFQPRTYVNAP